MVKMVETIYGAVVNGEESEEVGVSPSSFLLFVVPF
jgi:hypothetical protein